MSGPPLRLQAGDVIIVNGRHAALALMSDPALRDRPGNMPAIPVERDIARLDIGGDVRLLGGHVAVDVDRQDLLLDVLPPLIHIGGASEEARSLRWLSQPAGARTRRRSPWCLPPPPPSLPS